MVILYNVTPLHTLGVLGWPPQATTLGNYISSYWPLAYKLHDDKDITGGPLTSLSDGAQRSAADTSVTGHSLTNLYLPLGYGHTHTGFDGSQLYHS